MAAAVIQMGNLNFVASIISMFFLNTYGMINKSVLFLHFADEHDF